MIRLFRKIQARQIVAFATKRKNQEVKEPKKKKTNQNKEVPRFLTRGITLRLKKKQPMNDTPTVVSIPFSFYHNRDKNKGKETVKEKKTTLAFGNKRLIKGGKDYSEKYHKGINGFKEKKSTGNYSVNLKPIKIFQKKTKLVNVFHNTFLKIKPLFNILQKFTNLILKKNTYLIKETYPFLYGGLKGASTIGGFKKTLYNKVLVQDRKLKPVYNRRKHYISHYMVVQNQLTRLDKAFFYLGKNKLASIIGLALKVACYIIPRSFSWIKAKEYYSFNSKLSMRPRAIPNLVSIIEGQVTLLLWRNQFNNSLTKSRQDLRQGVSEDRSIFCKNNTAIVLKE